MAVPCFPSNDIYTKQSSYSHALLFGYTMPFHFLLRNQKTIGGIFWPKDWKNLENIDRSCIFKYMFDMKISDVSHFLLKLCPIFLEVQDTLNDFKSMDFIIRIQSLK